MSEQHPPKIGDVSPAEMQRMADDPGLLHIIINVMREGLVDVIQRVEKTMFMPPHGSNHEFTVMMLTWEELAWGIVTVPITYKARIEALLHQHGFRLGDGVPHCMQRADTALKAFGAKRPHDSTRGMTVISVFPLNSPRAYTLEPIHKEKGPIVAGMAMVEKKKERGTNAN